MEKEEVILYPIRTVEEGVAKIRDYDIKDAIDKKLSMKITFNTDYMILTSDELISKLERKGTKLWKSKTGGKDYYLWEYRWVPVEVEL